MVIVDNPINFRAFDLPIYGAKQYGTGAKTWLILKRLLFTTSFDLHVNRRMFFA